MHKKKILVVEDDQDIRELVSELLTLEGHEVMTAENGREALNLISKNEKFELVLLDLMMPVMDGGEFISEIRKSLDKKVNDLPIILLTASSKKAEEVRESVQGFIKKPIEIDNFLELIDQF